jgi:hypothetical protein
MLFYLLNDLVSVTRFFAKKCQDDELKISRGEHFRHPHPWTAHEARAKVTIASSPASEVTVMTVAFKRSKIVMSMHCDPPLHLKLYFSLYHTIYS